jgi:hypothetical protein
MVERNASPANSNLRSRQLNAYNVKKTGKTDVILRNPREKKSYETVNHYNVKSDNGTSVTREMHQENVML